MTLTTKNPMLTAEIKQEFLDLPWAHRVELRFGLYYKIEGLKGIFKACLTTDKVIKLPAFAVEVGDTLFFTQVSDEEIQDALTTHAGRPVYLKYQMERMAELLRKKLGHEDYRIDDLDYMRWSK